MAPFGDAVGLIARSEVRSRWRALLGLALLVALVGAVTLSALAGTRRTGSAVDRFVATTEARDVRISTIDRASADELDADLDQASWVGASARVARLVVATGGGSALTIATSPEAAFGTTVDRPLLLDGRLPLPGATHEIAIDEATVRDTDLGPGDTLEAQTMDPDNFSCAVAQTCTLELPDGPAETLIVTGIFRDVDGLVSREFSPEAYGASAFYDEFGDRTGTLAEEVLVRLDDGAADIDRLRGFVDERGDTVLVLDAEDDYLAFPTDAVNALGTGLLLFAVVSALAGALILAQAINRHIAVEGDRSLRLRELGLPRAMRATALAVPIGGAAVLGAVIAVVAAAPTSTWFPFAVADRIEPDPGFRIDPLVLFGGAAALILAVTLWAGWTAWRLDRSHHRHRAPKPSALAMALANVGADPALIGGARLAFERSSGRGGTLMRSALVATAVGSAGLVAAGIVHASLQDLVDSPARWGWNWDSVATPLDPAALAQTATQIADEDGVDGVAIYHLGLVDLDGEEVAGHALEEPVDIRHTLIDGERPDEDDEIALGQLTADELGVTIGDTVTATDPDGDAHDLEVVGTVALPTFQDRDPGLGALLAHDAWDTVTLSDGTAELVVRFEDGIDTATLEDQLNQDYAVGFRAASLPSRLDNLDQAKVIAPALAAFFASLAVLGLVHALVTGVRERRAMLAMLRLLGSRKAHVRRSVVWQSLFVALTGLVIGLPLGVLIGRGAWFVIIDGLGVVESPTVPVPQLVLLVPATIVVALLVAIAPAWMAARQRIAAALQPA